MNDSIKAYDKKILSRIQDPEEWPAFKRSNYLSELNEIADMAIKKDSIEGYLAAVLIYHQLCEEIVKLLIECSDFLIQVAIWPTRVMFKRDNKKMFGQLIDELEYSTDFKDKDKLISAVKDLNNFRINIVHKLTQRESLDNLKNDVTQMKGIFDKIFMQFIDVYDDYRVEYSGYRKNVDWEELDIDWDALKDK